MKKPYQKPEIAFDCFTLSTNIAAGCAVITNTFSANQTGCGYSMGNGLIMVFTSYEMGCTTTEQPGGNNTVCYHPPAGYNLFNS